MQHGSLSPRLRRGIVQHAEEHDQTVPRQSRGLRDDPHTAIAPPYRRKLKVCVAHRQMRGPSGSQAA